MRRHIASFVRHKVSAPTFVLQITTTTMLLGYVLGAYRGGYRGWVGGTFAIVALFALGFSSGVMMMAYEKFSPKEEE